MADGTPVIALVLISASTPPLVAAVYCSTWLALPAASACTLNAPFGPDTGSKSHLAVLALWKSSQKYRPVAGHSRLGPVSTTVLPVPVMAVTSLPPPAWASALALTSTKGRGLKAYGGVQLTLLETVQAPSAAPFSKEPLSLKVPAMVPEKSLTTSAQTRAPATSNTLLDERILDAWPTPTL